MMVMTAKVDLKTILLALAAVAVLILALIARLGGGEAPVEGMHNKLIIKGDDPIEHR